MREPFVTVIIRLRLLRFDKKMDVNHRSAKTFLKKRERERKTKWLKTKERE